MSGEAIKPGTAQELAGKLYVYRCADTLDAVAVSRFRVGPHGGLVGDTIARMGVPTAKLSRDELNEYARQFSEYPALKAKADALADELDAAIEIIDDQLGGDFPESLKAMRQALSAYRGDAA